MTKTSIKPVTFLDLNTDTNGIWYLCLKSGRNVNGLSKYLALLLSINPLIISASSLTDSHNNTVYSSFSWWDYFRHGPLTIPTIISMWRQLDNMLVSCLNKHLSHFWLRSINLNCSSWGDHEHQTHITSKSIQQLLRATWWLTDGFHIQRFTLLVWLKTVSRVLQLINDETKNSLWQGEATSVPHAHNGTIMTSSVVQWVLKSTSATACDRATSLLPSYDSTLISPLYPAVPRPSLHTTGPIHDRCLHTDRKSWESHYTNDSLSKTKAKILPSLS